MLELYLETGWPDFGSSCGESPAAGGGSTASATATAVDSLKHSKQAQVRERERHRESVASSIGRLVRPLESAAEAELKKPDPAAPRYRR